MITQGKYYILLLLLLTGCVISCSAQTIHGEELGKIFTPHEKKDREYSQPLREATSEISILASLGFIFYKTFISSQDKPSCVFTPSCSEYALQSVEKKGFFLGWLSTFDRLSRCHGFVHHEHYPFDPEKLRFHDPVD
jgi:putative component of membrane protein insertase Oxa1/YidC/SpoIIIJ protein YidD